MSNRSRGVNTCLPGTLGEERADWSGSSGWISLSRRLPRGRSTTGLGMTGGSTWSGRGRRRRGGGTSLGLPWGRGRGRILRGVLVEE